LETTNDLLWQLSEMAEGLSSTNGKPIDALHMAVGLVGESAEVLEMEKKAYFQYHRIDDMSFRMEIGDLLFYLLGLLEIREVPIQECIVAVLAKLRQRYPDGQFDAEKSRERCKLAERQAAMYAVNRWRGSHP
jgi:NTP pyrophosphatase (non-canonical NTP hydrolase)